MMIPQMANLVLCPVKRHFGPVVAKHTPNHQPDQKRGQHPDQKAHVHGPIAYPINSRNATNRPMEMTTAPTTKPGLEKKEDFLLIYQTIFHRRRD